jgi:hypothetical protein
MAIYRGPGGAGDAIADTTNQSAAAVSAAAQAAGSATAAATSASNAASSATSAASSAATAAAAQAGTVNFQQNLAVSATTLAAGSSATVSYNSGTTTMTFGIPTGATGPAGATGSTGPAGSAATVAVGTVTTGAPGSSASVTNAGTSSAAVLNFTIPRGDTGNTGATGAQGPAGLNWLGTYSGGTSYVVDDAVFYNGSSYVCKLSSTGNLPTNTTYWDTLAEKGAPGSGSGDVTGPASAVANRLVAFDGTSGKIIKDSGYSAASFEPADATILKSASIGVSVQGYDVNTAKYNAATANFTGTLQNGGHTVLTTASDYLDSTDIGVSVQGYDVDTAKYDAATANFTGTLQQGGNNVLTTAAVGSTVQAYDSNLSSFVTAFTLPTTDGTNGQVLQTNGSGTLVFTTPATGVSTGKSIAMAMIFGF